MLQTKPYTALFPLSLLKEVHFSLLALISLFGKSLKPIVLGPLDGRNLDDKVKQAFDALPLKWGDVRCPFAHRNYSEDNPDTQKYLFTLSLIIHDIREILQTLGQANRQLWTVNTRVGTLIVATIHLQLIQNRYMFRSFTVLQCSHQHCVQPVASDVEVVGYL